MNFRKVQPEALVKCSLGALHSHIACLAYWNWLEGSTCQPLPTQARTRLSSPPAMSDEEVQDRPNKEYYPPGEAEQVFGHRNSPFLICSPDLFTWYDRLQRPVNPTGSRAGQTAGRWGAASVRSAGTPYLQAGERWEPWKTNPSKSGTLNLQNLKTQRPNG